MRYPGAAVLAAAAFVAALAPATNAASGTSPAVAATDPLARLRALPEAPPSAAGEAAFVAASECGKERWTIKIGSDSGAPTISLTTVNVRSVGSMHNVSRPTYIPPDRRVSPLERRYYQVHATLTKYVREVDLDYHLVLQDSAGRTMIAEIPSSTCTSGSPWAARIAASRKAFDGHFATTSHVKTTSTSVTVRGIGFYDYIHGQTGTGPNGVELHPVLNITFS